MQHCVLKIGHRHHFGGVSELNSRLPLAGQLELVQKSQSGASFFLHNVVDKLGVKFNFQLSQCLFYFVKVVDFCLFVSPKEG